MGRGSHFASIPNSLFALPPQVAEGVLTATPSQDYDDSYAIAWARHYDAYIVTNGAPPGHPSFSLVFDLIPFSLFSTPSLFPTFPRPRIVHPRRISFLTPSPYFNTSTALLALGDRILIAALWRRFFFRPVLGRDQSGAPRPGAGGCAGLDQARDRATRASDAAAAIHAPASCLRTAYQRLGASCCAPCVTLTVHPTSCPFVRYCPFV